MNAYPVPVVPFNRGRLADELQLRVWEAQLKADQLPRELLDVLREVHAAVLVRRRPRISFTPWRIQ